MNNIGTPLDRLIAATDLEKEPLSGYETRIGVLEFRDKQIQALYENVWSEMRDTPEETTLLDDLKTMGLLPHEVNATMEYRAFNDNTDEILDEFQQISDLDGGFEQISYRYDGWVKGRIGHATSYAEALLNQPDLRYQETADWVTWMQISSSVKKMARQSPMQYGRFGLEVKQQIFSGVSGLIREAVESAIVRDIHIATFRDEIKRIVNSYIRTNHHDGVRQDWDEPGEELSRLWPRQV